MKSRSLSEAENYSESGSDPIRIHNTALTVLAVIAFFARDTCFACLSAASVMLIEPERSSLRRWGRRRPRNARSDSPVYEASKQSWVSWGAKNLKSNFRKTQVLTLEFRWRIRSRTEAHKFKEAVSEEEINNFNLSSLYRISVRIQLWLNAELNPTWAWSYSTPFKIKIKCWRIC